MADITVLIRSGAIDEMDKDPLLSKAPIVIRDALAFPVSCGRVFFAAILESACRLGGFEPDFPESAGLDPADHASGYLSQGRRIPPTSRCPIGRAWFPRIGNLLEENVMGEFGLEEILKQFLGEARCELLSPAWAGDRYAVFEDAKTKEFRLCLRLALDNRRRRGAILRAIQRSAGNEIQTGRKLFRRPNFFQFQTEPRAASISAACAAKCLDGRGCHAANIRRDQPRHRLAARTGPGRELRRPSLAQISGSSDARLALVSPRWRFLDLPRVPEPEVMDDSGEVEAYASAAAQAHLDADRRQPSSSTRFDS